VDDDTALARYRAGEALVTLAAEVGISRQAMARRVMLAAVRAGVEWELVHRDRDRVSATDRRRISDDRQRAILYLHDLGMSLRQIAEAVDVHRATVRKVVENAATDARRN